MTIAAHSQLFVTLALIFTALLVQRPFRVPSREATRLGRGRLRRPTLLATGRPLSAADPGRLWAPMLEPDDDRAPDCTGEPRRLTLASVGADRLGAEHEQAAVSSH